MKCNHIIAGLALFSLFSFSLIAQDETFDGVTQQNKADKNNAKKTELRWLILGLLKANGKYDFKERDLKGMDLRLLKKIKNSLMYGDKKSLKKAVAIITANINGADFINHDGEKIRINRTKKKVVKKGERPSRTQKKGPTVIVMKKRENKEIIAVDLSKFGRRKEPSIEVSNISEQGNIEEKREKFRLYRTYVNQYIDSGGQLPGNISDEEAVVLKKIIKKGMVLSKAENSLGDTEKMPAMVDMKSKLKEMTVAVLKNEMEKDEKPTFKGRTNSIFKNKNIFNNQPLVDPNQTEFKGENSSRRPRSITGKGRSDRRSRPGVGMANSNRNSVSPQKAPKVASFNTLNNTGNSSGKSLSKPLMNPVSAPKKDIEKTCYSIRD